MTTFTSPDATSSAGEARAEHDASAALTLSPPTSSIDVVARLRAAMAGAAPLEDDGGAEHQDYNPYFNSGPATWSASCVGHHESNGTQYELQLESPIHGKWTVDAIPQAPIYAIPWSPHDHPGKQRADSRHYRSFTIA